MRVTRWDRNEEIRRKAKIEETFTEKVDRSVLRCFGHVGRTDRGHRPRNVEAAKVEGQQRIGRPSFGWLFGVEGFRYQGGRLAGGSATHKKGVCGENL